MKPLHVAHVVCSDGFAGVERYVLQSALALTAAGCVVTVIGGAEGSMMHPLADLDIEWAPARGIPDAIRALRRQNDIDVIDTHMTSADAAGVAAGFLGRVPVVSTRHFAAPRGSGLAHRTLGAVVRTRVAAQIAISQFVANSIEGTSVVVHTGVPDVPDVDDAARERTVLVVQRLEAEKCTDVALRAFAAAGRAGRWRLIIAGDGAQRDALGDLAVELGIADFVDFIGFRTDIDAHLSRASVIVAPTPREGLGLSAIEAMAHGVPVVAAGAGGHLESVGAVADAALFAPGDALTAGRLLAELIDDQDRRWAYGHALRARQRESFSVTAQTSATLEILHRVAGR